MSTVALDYLVVGHVTRDLVAGGYRIGGTASYSARAGLALGCRVGVLTSASLDLDLSEALDGALVTLVPAATSTTFENLYDDGIEMRRQQVHGVAEHLTRDMVPAGWRPEIVHLGPLVRECDEDLLDAFGDPFIGLTPQGWLRRWDEYGRVSPSEWEGPDRILRRADAVVLSEMDVAGAAQIDYFASQTRVLVVTTGASGCVVHCDGGRQEFPAEAIDEVDPTGAGDIFATAFFVKLRETGDVAVSADFANCFAAPSVARAGLASTPTEDEVDRCRRQFAS